MIDRRIERLSIGYDQRIDDVMLLIKCLGQQRANNIVMSNHGYLVVFLTILTQQFLYLVTSVPQLLRSLVNYLILE